MPLPALLPLILAAGGGTLLGGLLSGKGGGGQPEEFKQIDRFNPQQKSALDQLLQQGMQGLQNPQSLYSGFEPIRQQAVNTFQNEIVPSLAERFTASTNASPSSPSFASQVGQASAGFGNNLNALQAQWALSQQNHLRSLLGMGLTPQFDTLHRPETQDNTFPQLLSLIGGGLGAFGGPIGASVGFGLGSQLGSFGQNQAQPYQAIQSRYSQDNSFSPYGTQGFNDMNTLRTAELMQNPRRF